MNSIKCPTCGLINFATATECKRCKQNLEAHEYPYWRGNNAVEPPKPDWSKLQTVPAVPAEIEELADYGDGSHPIGTYLFGIYLILVATSAPYTLGYLNSEFTPEIWKALTDPKSKLYLASFEPFYHLVVTGTVVFPLAAIVLLVTLFLKARVFLKWVVIYLVGEFLYSSLQGWFILRVHTELTEKRMPQLDNTLNQLQYAPLFCVIAILFTFIWFRYFTTSQRARSAFD